MGAVVQRIAPTFKLLLPDVETSLTTQDLNLLLTKSRVYRQISDHRDNRLSKDVYTTQIILIINFIKERR